MSEEPIRSRLAALDWNALESSLDEWGFARTSRVLTDEECDVLIASYGVDANFRKRIDMERHRFGVGDYAYFQRPLPPLVADLREHLYAHLAPIANRWSTELGLAQRYPSELHAFLAHCAKEGQERPTPLVLRYSEGGYNCLHQDLYGDVAFPLQATGFLSTRGRDYTGGEFLLVEQRPRAQSRGEAIPGDRGELVIFPNAVRPTQGKRGVVRTNLRHGVSRLTRGERYALGIIFHDAK